MINIVIGNILSLVATCFTIANGTRKNKRDMLMCDMGSALSFTLCDWVLKGYSGVVQNLVGLTRDIVALFVKDGKVIGWILVACGVIFGVYFNNHGLIGLLPVVTCCYYSVCVLNPNASPKVLKIALILNSISFAIYSAVLWNVVGVCTNTVVIITTAIAVLKDKESQK